MTDRQIPEMTEQVLSATLELISDGVWDWHVNSGYVYRSPGWYTMLGYPVDAFATNVMTWEQIIHPDDYPRVMAHFEDYISDRTGQYKIEYRCRNSEGAYVWIEDRGRLVARNPDGSPARMIGAHRDIDAQKRLLEQSTKRNLTLSELVDRQTGQLRELNQALEQKVREQKQLANTDTLTGIPNRYCFENRLKSECSRAQRFREPLSLLAIDIDNFKPINDRYGHLAGDRVLVAVARTILNNIRDIDVAARWGGDELMVLLVNTQLNEAEQVAEKLRKLTSRLAIEPDLSLSISVGGTQLQPGEDPMQFTIRADNALYAAKAAGRNTVKLQAGVA